MGKRMKKLMAFLLGICMTATTILPGAAAAEVKAAVPDLTQNLAGYWSFDNGTMDNQASGSEYTAELVGAGVTLQNDGGVSGGSVQFTKQADSDIRLAGILNAAQEDFSIAAWVKYDDDAFASSTSNMNLFQQTGSGRTILYLNSGLTYGTYLTGSDSMCAENTELGSWNHVIITSNHSTKTVQFYLNGKLINTNQLSGDYYDGTTDVLVGIHKNLQAAGAIKGNIDELRFYKSVISEDMAESIYSQHAAVKELQSLRNLVEEAKGLSGSEDDEAVQNLLEKITAAEAFLNSDVQELAALREVYGNLEAAMTVYRASVKILISVDTSDELREISDNMFGINHRYHNDGYSSYNAAEEKIEEQFNEYVKEAGFGSIRYPGGTVSNLFDWKRSIGPVEQRKKTVHGLPDSNQPITPNFGVDEAMTWIYDELDSDAIWVYGMGQGSAADAADLFEYLNAPNDGSNPNGGIDWAAERAKNGHEEPYGVTNFEIGNEIGYYAQTYWMDGRASGRSTTDCYIDGGTMNFGQNTRTVKEEDWRTSAANSDGTAGQERFVKYLPVTQGSVSVYVGGTQWTIVDSLSGKGQQNVCTFDYDTGKITFGDGTDGNIPASGSVITAAYQTVQDGFVDYYRALKDIAEQLDMEINVYSCIYWEEFTTLMKEKGYNEYYDGVVIHPYSDSTNLITQDDPMFYEKILGRSLDYNITRVQALVDRMEAAAPGMNKVPVLSEFGIYQYNSKFVRSIGHAVYIANEMIDYINLGTPYINKHCLVDYPYEQDSLGAGSQCVIQAIKNSDGTVSFVSTPSAKMFSIFNNMTGSTEVGQTLEGNVAYYTYSGSNGAVDVPTVKVLSSKDEEGNTYVTVVNNRKDDETPVRINVDGRDLTGTNVEVWYLTSENVDDENTLDDPDNVDVVKTAVESGETLDYNLAPHSVTAFRIPAQEEIPELPYKDVAENDWYHSYVYDVYLKGLMTGMEETVFAPQGKLVRAQFATILWRMEGSPKMEYTDRFPDVADGQFYTDAVLWAAEKGIATGYTGTGMFGPNDNINREQVAAMMYRYATYKKYDVSNQEGLDAFKDADQVNEFAQTPMKWCVAEKIFTGDNGNLKPQGETIRAEAATIISRFTDTYK